jgi:sarcosine oxidase
LPEQRTLMHQRTEYDVIVIGLGATGGSALYHLARSGSRVLGIDQFAPPHGRGSSHGHTRIYRQAYYEAPAYVPLARRALELWHELEREGDLTLFANTGVLTIGAEDSELVSGALRSAREHDIAHELLSYDETMRRFPAFRSPAGAIALFEPTGGVLFADLCVETHLKLAARAGAEIHTNEAVQSIDWSDSNSVVVHTATGSYSAGRVIVAAGAWAPKLLGLQQAFRVTRESVFWFESVNADALAATCPVSMIAMDDGRMLYTIPDFGDGFKAGLHHTGLPGDPDITSTPIDSVERNEVLQALKRHVPAGAGKVRESSHCYYTSTPDFHFAMGALPWAKRVILAAACSGHGFKFATALGEALALATRDAPNLLPADVFDVGRLARDEQ